MLQAAQQETCRELCQTADLGHCEGRAPLVLQDVQADAACAVDIAVVDPGPEDNLQGTCAVKTAQVLMYSLAQQVWTHFRRLEGVV